jgi:hypothetical protein
VSAEVDEDSSVLCSPRAVPPTEAGGQEQARHDLQAQHLHAMLVLGYIMDRVRCQWMDLRLLKISSYLYGLREVPQGYNAVYRNTIWDILTVYVLVVTNACRFYQGFYATWLQ